MSFSLVFYVEPSTYRRLKDALAEEFERLRKYFSLLDLGTSDLKVRREKKG